MCIAHEPIAAGIRKLNEEAHPRRPPTSIHLPIRTSSLVWQLTSGKDRLPPGMIAQSQDQDTRAGMMRSTIATVVDAAVKRASVDPRAAGANGANVLSV